MRVTRLLPILIACFALTGCFSDHSSKPRVPAGAPAARVTPPAPTARGSAQCFVPLGQGAMGRCAPRPPATARFGPALPAGPSTARGVIYRGVDVSSYQGCRRWAVQFVIFKAYEFGYHQDPSASCEHRANSDKPNGPYFFARPGSPSSHAAIAASVARGLGATRSLPGTLDYEVAAGGCSYIRSFGDRYMALTGTHRFIVYSALFIWPRCTMPSSYVLWDAAYGSHWNDLPTFSGGATIWQYSNGQVGPTPHLYGIDSDIFLRSSPAELVAASNGAPPKPAVPPATAHATALCVELKTVRQYVHDKIERNRKAGRERHWSNYPKRKRRADSIKTALAKPKPVKGYPGKWRYDCKPDGSCGRAKA